MKGGSLLQLTLAFCLYQTNYVLLVCCPQSLHVVLAQVHIRFYRLLQSLSLHVSFGFHNCIFHVYLRNFQLIFFHLFPQLHIKTPQIIQLSCELRILKHFTILFPERMHLILISLFFKVYLLLDGLKRHVIVLKNELLFPYRVLDLFVKTCNVFLQLYLFIGDVLDFCVEWGCLGVERGDFSR